MRTGQSRKRDVNEKAIVAALRAVGAHVFRISGEGCPDLFVGYNGLWTPLEVKSKTGRSTEKQQAVKDAGITIARVETIEDALEAIGIHQP